MLFSSHGTAAGYSNGCRCADCTDANRVYKANYYAENRERIKARRRARYWANRDRELEKRRVYDAANPRHVSQNRDRASRWYYENKDRAIEYSRVRRARLRDAFVESVPADEVYAEYDWTCYLCGYPLDMKAKAPQPLSPCVDHIEPLAKGGLHERVNLAAAHWVCNSRKTDRSVWDVIPMEPPVELWA